MKKLFVILLSLSLLLACVPTPEKDAVKQKDTNVLIETVRAEDREQQNAQATLPPVREQFPERFQCEKTVGSGAHLVADVPIHVLTEGNFPVLRVVRTTLTNDERLTLAKRFLGTDTVYEWSYHLTRETVAKQIAALIEEPTEADEQEWLRTTGFGEDEWQRMLDERRAELERLQKVYNELPTDDTLLPLPEYDGRLPLILGQNWTPVWVVGSPYEQEGQSRHRTMQYMPEDLDRPAIYQSPATPQHAGGFDIESKPHDVIPQSEYDRPHDGASITPNEAIAIAKAPFESIVDLTAVSVLWANDADTDGEGAGVANNWAYVVRFSPVFHGAGLCYCTSSAYNKDEQNDEYIEPWQYEYVTVVVGGDGEILCADWFGALRVTDVISESATLLPYEDILKAFEQQMERRFAEGFDDATVTVTDLQLGLFRIREKNDPYSGLLVPAWFFTGDCEFAGSKTSFFGPGYPLCVINAIDGSIIDPRKGY